MNVFLPDVNVLIALLDPTHVHHERAHTWFERGGNAHWLSCPMTQDGVLRIVSNPRYSNRQPMRLIVDSLRSLLAAGSHTFVPDDVSLLESELVRSDRLLNSAQVTDTYLIALARTHRARLATFDARIVSSAVLDGADAICQIP